MSELKLIYEPTVYLMGRMSPLVPDAADYVEACGGNPVALLSQDVSGPELLCEVAGRTCYQSFRTPRPGGNAAYLKHILESGHGSVLEHAVYAFVFTGLSRSLTHELVRHRAGWSYSELSQRYVDCTDVAFVVPPALSAAVWAARAADDDGKPETGPRTMEEWAGQTWLAACKRALIAYGGLVEHLVQKAPPELPATDRRKWARQAARSVLPNCTETKIHCTTNARAIRHFIELRGSRHADTEIRRLAVALLHVMRQQAPNLFGDYRLQDLPDGSQEVLTDWRKV